MRKTVACLLVVVLLWIGYLAWPLHDLLTLVHAVDDRDIATVTRHVHFERIRVSLTNQIVAAYVRRSGIHVSPLAQQVAAISIADPVVSKLVSADALSELLAAGWPVTVIPDRPPDVIGLNMRTIGTIWQVFGASEYGIDRFEVSLPTALPSMHRFHFVFRLLQWRWQLIELTLPGNIQNVLADELAKSLPRLPPQANQ